MQMLSKFSAIPERAINDKRLGDAAFRVLGAICKYVNKYGTCYLKQKTIAGLRGVTRQAISKQIHVLIELGYVVRTRRYDNESGAEINSVFQVIYEPAKLFTPATPNVAPPSTPDVAPPLTPDVAPPATPEVAHNKCLNVTHEQTTTCSSDFFDQHKCNNSNSFDKILMLIKTNPEKSKYAASRDVKRLIKEYLEKEGEDFVINAVKYTLVRSKISFYGYLKETLEDDHAESERAAALDQQKQAKKKLELKEEKRKEQEENDRILMALFENEFNKFLSMTDDEKRACKLKACGDSDLTEITIPQKNLIAHYLLRKKEAQDDCRPN